MSSAASYFLAISMRTNLAFDLFDSHSHTSPYVTWACTNHASLTVQIRPQKVRKSMQNLSFFYQKDLNVELWMEERTTIAFDLCFFEPLSVVRSGIFVFYFKEEKKTTSTCQTGGQTTQLSTLRQRRTTLYLDMIRKAMLFEWQVS